MVLEAARPFVSAMVAAAIVITVAKRAGAVRVRGPTVVRWIVRAAVVLVVAVGAPLAGPAVAWAEPVVPTVDSTGSGVWVAAAAVVAFGFTLLGRVVPRLSGRVLGTDTRKRIAAVTVAAGLAWLVPTPLGTGGSADGVGHGPFTAHEHGSPSDVRGDADPGRGSTRTPWDLPPLRRSSPQTCPTGRAGPGPDGPSAPREPCG